MRQISFLSFLILLLITGCKKQDTLINQNVSESQLINQVKLLLASEYTASSLTDLSFDSLVISKKNDYYVIRIPFKSDGGKNFILLGGDFISGIKVAKIFNLAPVSNILKGEQFTGFITIRDLKGKLIESRQLLNGFNISKNYKKNQGNNLVSLDDDPDCPGCVNLPEVIIVAPPRIDLFADSYYSAWINLALLNNDSSYDYWFIFDPINSNINYTPNPSIVHYQKLLDLQWLNNIKDSTNNPCATLVISKLQSMVDSLPELFRKIFDSSANINITFKSGTFGATQAANTNVNTTSNNFVITYNNFYSNASTLSIASTLLHEMIHAQLMNWYRLAVYNNDYGLKVYLTEKYYLFFDSTNVAQYPDNDFINLMNNHQVGQHDIIAFGNIRDELSNALLQFAQLMDPQTTVNRLYTDDLAWNGVSDSHGWGMLPNSEKARLNIIIEGERGNSAVSPNYIKKGDPCP